LIVLLVDQLVKIIGVEGVTYWGAVEKSAHKNGTYGDIPVYKK
jgi:hypothetical protein